MSIKEAFHKWNSISLVKRILCGLIIGIILGLVVPQATGISILGDLFVGALKGIAPILVFFLVMSALSNMAEGQRTNMKAIVVLYILGNLTAAMVAVIAHYLFPVSMTFASGTDVGDVAPPSGVTEVLTNLLMNLVDNPVNAIVNANTQRAKEQYGSAIPFDLHPIIRNRDCCLKSTQLAVELALATGARLHVAHVSTRDEVDYLKQFATGPLATRQISCEVCIPHLFFNESDYSRLHGFLKCNPAVKYEFDRLSLIRALRAGIITTIGTDHAPHELAVKNSSDYLKVASGLPSVQFSLNVIFELARRHELSLEEGLKAATCNVAARFGIEQRGTLKEGFFADIAVLDTSSRYTVTPEDVASLCGWSPMVGQSFSSRVTHTIASGHLVVADGKLVGEPGQAQALRFNNAR